MGLKRNILDLRKRKKTIEKGGGEKAIQKQVSQSSTKVHSMSMICS